MNLFDIGYISRCLNQGHPLDQSSGRGYKNRVRICTLEDRDLQAVQWMCVEDLRPPNTSTDVCGCALSVMLLTLAVVPPTPHDYSGTFQGGCSATFTASRKDDTEF